jgi:hypothetical protein
MTALPWPFFVIIKKVDPAHTTKADGGVEVQHYSFLTLVLAGMSSPLHALAALTPEKELPHTPLNVGWWGFPQHAEEINLLPL